MCAQQFAGAHMHVRNVHAKFGLHACQGHEYVHVLRCVPLVIQDANPDEEFLTVKLKQLGYVSFTDYHW